MAKRYVGKHSPGATGGIREELKVDGAGARANLLFVPPALLAFTSLASGAATLAIALAGAATLAAGAWLLREGLRAEAAYAQRKVARRPAFPRKIAAAIVTGLGAALASLTGPAELWQAALYGVAALGLHIAAFGIDPLRDKRADGVDDFQRDRVAKVVDEAEAYLADMRAQIDRLGDRKLTDRVGRFQVTARRMIRTVEEDPRDLTGARKYLGVYLMGARDATVKFVDLYDRRDDPQARADYETLLEDLQHNFAARTEGMLADDRSDMDVEIKVLRDRLNRDGVQSE